MSELYNFSAWKAKKQSLEEVRGWLRQIGAKGRESDVLRLSPAHCKAPKFTIAGQYQTGGTNYWESPVAFDQAMQEVVLKRFADLAAEAVALLEHETSLALIALAEEADAKVAKKAAAEERRRKWREREIASGRMKVMTPREFTR